MIRIVLTATSYINNPNYITCDATLSSDMSNTMMLTFSQVIVSTYSNVEFFFFGGLTF